MPWTRSIVVIGGGPAGLAVAAVGVLTHECDADYERGQVLIAQGACP
jgi:cation diffusion facilitator CzcD-associated flavoprotein CzcO